MQDADIIESGLQHYDCVLKSVTNGLEQICGLAVRQCETAVDLADEEAMLAVISLGCAQFDWSVVFGLPRDTATEIAAKFAGFEIAFDSDDMGDAVGEVANILAGLIQKELAARGVVIELSLPSIMKGRDLAVLPQTHDVKSTAFDCEAGMLRVWVVAEGISDISQLGEPPAANAELEQQQVRRASVAERIKQLEAENAELQKAVLERNIEIANLKKII
ncbi:MAG: chemotaxis protein CheX [Planctomycetes bacterium]|nr:chemotaxis protein CheX [Planctomycetota bacterium]